MAEGGERWEGEHVAVTKGQLVDVLVALEAGWELADTALDLASMEVIEAGIHIVSGLLGLPLPPAD